MKVKETVLGQAITDESKEKKDEKEKDKNEEKEKDEKEAEKEPKKELPPLTCVNWSLVNRKIRTIIRLRKGKGGNFIVREVVSEEQ